MQKRLGVVSVQRLPRKSLSMGAIHGAEPCGIPLARLRLFTDILLRGNAANPEDWGARGVFFGDGSLRRRRSVTAELSAEE